MATIGPVTLTVVTDVANVNITVSYSLTGSPSDITSGQRYTEVCKLIGDDTGINPPEDNTDDAILDGLLTLGGDGSGGRGHQHAARGGSADLGPGST